MKSKKAIKPEFKLAISETEKICHGQNLCCPKCGSKSFHSKGWTSPKKTTRKYKCKDCQKIFTENPKSEYVHNIDWNSEIKKDIWDVRNLGLSGHITEGQYKLNFTSISQLWLRESAKKYIHYSLSTLTYNASKNRLQGIQRFSLFLKNQFPYLDPSDINRSVIVEFLNYLSRSGLSEQTRIATIGSLKNFLELCSRHQWVNVPEKVVIYREDYPKLKKPLPKFIPQEVLEKLNQYLDELPESIRRMVLVLQECGMRITELCLLPFDCLLQDQQKDWFIKYYQYKMKKEIIIPISRELANLIKEQQQYINSQIEIDFPYLFCSRKPGGNYKDFIANSKPILSKSFTTCLNKLAQEKNICDISGRVWHFHPHQFRHTVGTRMINNGVPQHIVQRYLGHESPEMTMVYAHIHDETLRKEIEKYHESKVVNFQGKTAELEETVLASGDDLEWFKKTVQARALEHGYCARPKLLGDCDIPGFDGCYNCPHWRTNKNFLPVLKDTLERTENVLNKARNCGWGLQVKKNEPIKVNLEKVIKSLEEAS